MSGVLIGSLAALGVLVTVAAGLSLWLHYRAGSAAELKSQLRQLDLDVADLYERLDSFTKRANVRAGRERAAEASAAQSVVDRKTQLRAKLQTFLQNQGRTS